jgi:hypothetical protein
MRQHNLETYSSIAVPMLDRGIGALQELNDQKLRFDFGVANQRDRLHLLSLCQAHLIRRSRRQSSIDLLRMCSNGTGQSILPRTPLVIDLSSCGLTDHFMVQLADSLHFYFSRTDSPTTSVELYLQDNSISDKGVGSLTHALERCSANIRILDLTRNRVGDTGARFLAETLSRTVQGN